MAKRALSVTFRGRSVESGVIDAHRLGSALLAMNSLIQATKSLDPELKAEKLDVVIEATKEGSFEIQMILEGVATIWGTVRDWLVGDDGTAVERITTLVVALITVLGLIKRGGAPVSVETTLEAATLRFPDGTEAVVSLEAWSAYLDARVANAAADLVSVLDEGVDELEIAGAGHDLIIRQPDQVAFEEHADRSSAESEPERRTTVVTPVSVVLSGAGKWRVDEYGTQYAATMNDEHFKSLLSQGWNISSNDEYRVTVLSSEYRTPTGQRRFRHVIETVDSYRRTSGEAFRELPVIRQDELS